MTPYLLVLSALAAEPVGDVFNYVVGTQTFGAAYQFTDQTRLVETARAILELGSNLIKFKLDRHYADSNGNVRDRLPGIDCLTALCRDEPSHRQVFDMPFAYYLLWAYPFTGGWWHDGFSDEEREREYREIRDLCEWFLATYDGTGKRFYLGHWEGDWHLRDGYRTDGDETVTDTAVAGMIDWLNTRQRAIDDARRAIPHHDVEVYGYTEVNLVCLAMQGRRTVTNNVLPHTNVDYVSYSSYDTQGDPADLRAALDYLEAKLPAKEGVAGKRVFIGEYGFPAIHYPPEEQDRRSRQVMRVGIEWGCPFVLYWEIYNNEVGEDGRQRGFWMIDDRGVRQPVYETHRRLYERARRWVAEFIARAGRQPTAEEYAAAAGEWLR